MVLTCLSGCVPKVGEQGRPESGKPVVGLIHLLLSLPMATQRPGWSRTKGPQGRLQELKRFNLAIVGRELHAIGQKKGVNNFDAQCGLPP